jgi:hypothetical protein
VVVVVTGAVVGVVVGAVVVLGAVVPVEAGAVVVVEVVDPCSPALMRAKTMAPEGLGSVVPAGAKPMVTREFWPSLRDAGLPETLVLVLETYVGQYWTSTTPAFPASGVPAAHVWPFFSTAWPG